MSQWKRNSKLFGQGNGRGKKENIWKRKFFRQGRRRRMDKERRNIFVLSLSYFGFHFYIFIFIPSFEDWPQSVHTVQMFTEEENYDVNIVITSQKTCCTCDNNDQDNINNIDNEENLEWHENEYVCTPEKIIIQTETFKTALSSVLKTWPGKDVAKTHDTDM